MRVGAWGQAWGERLGFRPCAVRVCAVGRDAVRVRLRLRVRLSVRVRVRVCAARRDMR